MVLLSKLSFFATLMSQEFHPLSDMISVTLQSTANPLYENGAITYNHHICNF